MKKAALSVLYMFLLTFFFTGVVSAVKYANDDRIARNEAIKLQKVILGVLGIKVAEEASAEEILEVFDKRVETVAADDTTVYVGYDPDGGVRGYAFPVGGAGFWGPVRGLAAVDPLGEKMIGLDFYSHSETPGLGGRMTEDWFKNQFRDLKLRPADKHEQFFQLTESADKSDPRQLDAITGASRTSDAIETFLNRTLHRFLEETWPKLQNRT
jgi:Na+-transporting NADH:ubiquinone oxidoreductase subunit C